ncbi:uncharacterized protein LOC106662094 [Cimex lectularius]|uniref:Uncharacterized protein n=1 Tax=Cimex lectularius TaxID=79782 RepID=A0A8I6RA36_CIMLE|nr:uncharacterized protein LOC106662094 [Cimex lectularius]
MRYSSCKAADLSKFGKSHKQPMPEMKPPNDIDLTKGTLFIPREEDVQTIQHPVIVQLMPKERLVKNRFIESLYMKYPHLLPKQLPADGIHSLTVPNRNEHYTTSYMHDFAPMKDRFELTRRPRITEQKNRLSIRDPYRPYPPGLFNNSITKQASQNWPYEPKPETLARPTKIYRKSSEYNDNYNRMAKLFNRLNVYSNKKIVLKHQNTFPPFENRRYRLNEE